jgi:hypothetical protein
MTKTKKAKKGAIQAKVKELVKALGEIECILKDIGSLDSLDRLDEFEEAVLDEFTDYLPIAKDSNGSNPRD